MHLTYDPGDGAAFWSAIRLLPGYPVGVEHPIRSMLFESGAVFQLPEILQSAEADPTQPILVVMDTTPMQRNSEDLKRLVLDVLCGAGFKAQPVLMTPDATGQVHTDMPHIEDIQRRLVVGASVLSVGSGVVTDIAKHGCFLFEKETGYRPPFVVFQTANSVNAFTSNMAPTFINGVKRTLPSRYADALVCDLETLRDAPYAMTAAGFGDCLAFFVSLPDWYLAYCLGMDSGYSELPQHLMGPLEQILAVSAPHIRAGSLDGVAVLAKLIALGGLVMSLSHATAPLSGFEHVLSHTLDLQAEIAGRPLAPHGAQVALAALIGSEMYRQFIHSFDPKAVHLDNCFPDREKMQRTIETAFASIDPSGKAGAECWADYRLKLEKWSANKDRVSVFLDEWGSIRRKIQEVTCPPERMMDLLIAVGAPLKFEELEPPASEGEVHFAFMNACLTRNRLSLGDLLFYFQWDRQALWRSAIKKTQVF